MLAREEKKKRSNTQCQCFHAVMNIGNVIFRVRIARRPVRLLAAKVKIM